MLNALCAVVVELAAAAQRRSDAEASIGAARARSRPGRWAAGLALVCALAAPASARAQDSVRAWYADGQVWVVWRTTTPDPETYAIYAGPAAFTNTSDAALIGRLFLEEWAGGRLKDNASDTAITYTIPDGAGGIYTLAADEGLFVETVQAAEAKFYAVAKWGDTDVTNSVTANAATSLFGPAETVECHAQRAGTTAAGNPFTIYGMWADGRDDQNAGRPDFPVMANAAKNGAPHLFIVSEPVGGAAGGPHPAVWFLHGGGGSAKQSYPHDRPELGLEITQGYLVAHDDRMVRMLTSTPESSQTTWFFGWRKNYDPFMPEAAPALGDTVVNYTQRRLLWINEWMIRRLDLDRRRVAVLGHSMGSSGANQIGKAFPSAFAVVGVFNNGFGGPNGAHALLGDAVLNLPTNLVDRGGALVHTSGLWDMTTNISPQRDLALTRVFSGKDDENGTMQWDSLLVANYREADAEGWGIHTYWDERAHGLEQWDSYWSHGAAPDSQTARDDAAYQTRYRSNQSYPAFYNLQFESESADPGDGSPTSGDSWGTWGGFHDWDLNTIGDQFDRWGVTAFLVGDSAVGGTGSMVDASPFDSLASSVAIRKPQNFQPAEGMLVDWFVIRIADGDTLQRGATVVREDGLVTASGVKVYRDPYRVRIIFAVDASVGIGEPDLSASSSLQLRAAPNPFGDAATIRFRVTEPGRVRLAIFDASGRLLRAFDEPFARAGERVVRWDGRGADGHRLPSGVYFCRLEAGAASATSSIRLLR